LNPPLWLFLARRRVLVVLFLANIPSVRIAIEIVRLLAGSASSEPIFILELVVLFLCSLDVHVREAFDVEIVVFVVVVVLLLITLAIVRIATLLRLDGGLGLLFPSDVCFLLFPTFLLFLATSDVSGLKLVGFGFRFVDCSR
jgi:hypothetical protein